MALIPLKETVSISRVQLDSNGDRLIDAWGNSTYLSPVSYKSRINESAKLVKNQQGYEVMSNTQLLLGGKVAVSYEDEVSWTDSNGDSITKKPVTIRRIKDISSKVLFTEVSF